MTMIATLCDGRALAYCEYGAPRGTPVLWFPGTPSSRLFIPPDARLLADRGVRLVVVERPGYGCSTARPGRAILDWPADVTGLAAALGLERFAVVGFSGGGPYAAACAYAMRARIRRLILIGATPPLDAPGVRASIALRGKLFFALMAGQPWLARAIVRWMRPSAASIQRGMVRHLAPCDQELLARGDFMAGQIALTEEALRPGYDTWIHEIGLVARPWGFAIEQIEVDTVLLWGAEDRTTTLAMAGAYARIRGARLRVVENAGHFVHLARWDLVVEAMVE
jgi:pimeloyl-ACP methyl ester carboxylesterase